MAKAASGPVNPLSYNISMEWAVHKFIVRGELGNGDDDAIALPAPKKNQEQLEAASESEPNSERRKDSEAASDQADARDWSRPRNGGDETAQVNEEGMKKEVDQPDRMKVEDGDGKEAGESPPWL
ncbi:hypothetical protein BDZ45DRAFT_678311 [Acephala macrosclerotiorum]|nr:hypothetical protein BDZ45DRAFT_678311 [Acephala macrosclerotiorum]